MFKEVTVQYLANKSNFCYLGYNLTKELGQNSSIVLADGGNREFIFSVGTQIPNVEEGFIGINSVYAKLLGINENMKMVLSKRESITRVTRFTIQPLRYDDFHVLDLLKAEVENCVLNQVSVVSCHQELLIWIGENLNIPVLVVSIEPSSPGRLHNLTELVILPCVKKAEMVETNNSLSLLSVTDSISKTQQMGMFNLPEGMSDTDKIINDKIEKYLNRNGTFIARLLPCMQNTNYEFLLSYEFNILLNRRSAPVTWRMNADFQRPLFCSLKVTNCQKVREVFVRVFLIDEMPGIPAQSNSIFVNSNLMKILGCNLGTRVLLEPLRNINECSEVEVHANHDRLQLRSMLQNYLAERCNKYEFILNADVPITLSDFVNCSLRFKPNYVKYCLVNQEFLRTCKYSFLSDHVQTIPTSKQNKMMDYIETSINRNIIGDIQQNVLRSLTRNDHLGCFLITGNIGTGKSKIIEKLQNSLFEAPYFLYSEIVQSKTFKGKILDSLHKLLTTILERAVSHQPSVLFIDDLHILCKNVKEGDVLSQNSLYYDRISEMIYLLLLSVVENYQIGIVATTESIEDLNRNFYRPRGTYLFQKQYLIDELTKVDKVNIMKLLLEDKHCEFDLEDFSRKTEGFVFQDLYDLSQKIKFESVKNDDGEINDEHFQKALSQMVLLSHTDIKLHSPGNNDFSNVGGLADVKKLFGEILMWPLQYPDVFSTAPLRLQSGILLYGPPGTGKTLLAGSAAKEYGVRLISIKGPELLSKYIGASEQAVRNVFLQAQSAKPCILFFDEFDSLAPRRGHDSTGVTDRVVNQFLTQMDGIESLSGVFVLAATSRPDLLDPALLRPGRLDKQIYCSLPDKNSRLHILKVLSKSMNLSEEVNLDEIATKTEGFSGADLQCLLYNAQLSTMEHLLSERYKSSEILQPITHRILLTSLQKTKPSLSEKELLKYSVIYTKFQGKSTADILKPGTKASLA